MVDSCMKKAYIIISIVLVCLTLTTFLLVNKSDFTTQSDQPQSSVKTDTLYRILKSDGDTAIWNAKDCNVHSSFFSCVRLIPQPSPRGRHIYPHYSYKNMDGNRWFNELSSSDKKRLAKDIMTSLKKSYPIAYSTKTRDTIFVNLNFGKDSLSSYIPQAIKPTMHPKQVISFFSSIPNNPCSELLRFKSFFSLEPIGLPDFLTWQDNDPAYIVKNDQSGNKQCYIDYKLDAYRGYRHHIFEQLPERAQTYTYQIFNTTFKPFKDTTFSWKLVYKDLHGIGDTLDITTTIMAHEDDTSTKCFNHITGSRHCNFNLQPMRMNRRYLDRRFWRLKKPMIK